MMKKLKIKLDIDGVLRNMEKPMLQLYNNEFGVHMTSKDIITYDVDVAFPLIKEKTGLDAFKYFFDVHANETILNADRYIDSREAVNKLREYGYEIDIVSYQPSITAKNYTLGWLEKHDIKYDNIIFTNNPTKMILSAHIVIDDRVEYLTEDTNAYKVCIDHAYNHSWFPKPGVSLDGCRCANLYSAAVTLCDSVFIKRLIELKNI